MSALTTAPDTELVARAADGEHAAFAELFARYADAVHDHVARWSRDAALAADATNEAFLRLLHDLDGLRGHQATRAWLLRTARDRAIAQLRRGQDEQARGDTRIAPAVLAATSTDRAAPPEATAVAHQTAERVWEAATDLDERTFTVLDLHVRQALGRLEVATVMDGTPETVDALMDRVRERMRRGTGADDPLGVYGALAEVRAPVSVRTSVMTTAAEHFGTARPPGQALRRVAPFAAVLALMLAVGGIATALRSATPEPAPGPPTAAGEVVAPESPTPPAPSPTPTLEALPSPSPVPVPPPEPTVEPAASPSPSPSPQPSPTPSPTAQPLAVQVDDPQAGELFEATTTDDQGRQAAVVPVAATVSGSDGFEVTWTSSLAPQEPLLQDVSGELVLWLSEDCQETDHTLTVTATDDDSGETASTAVQVKVLDTCVDPLAVSIDQPSGDGGPIEATYQQEQDAFVATVTIAGSANDDVDWSWTTDAGQQLAEQQGTTDFQPREVRVVVEGCPGATTVTIQLEVVRISDGSSASDAVTLDVTCFRPS